MNRLWLLLVVLPLSACGDLAVVTQTQEAAPAVPPAVTFPDQEEPPERGSLEEMMKRHADVLQVTANNTVRLQVQHSEVDIHPDEDEFDIFVIQLLRSLRKYEGRGDSSGLTLQDLQPVTLPDDDQSVPETEPAALAQAYRAVLETNGDPAVRLQVQHRLADIMSLEGEAALSGEDGGNARAYFAESIRAYETLLQGNPDYPSNDQLLYQLAKAHALSGANDASMAALDRLAREYPNSPYVPEVEFRRAESLFAAADYDRADLAYTQVIGYGEVTPYYRNALYMQGWSRLKQGDYRRAIEPLSKTLDRVMPADNNMEAMDPGERELAQDCLRALAVIFSQLDGAQSISQAYEQRALPSYQKLLYLQLADLYLAQERYGDSAETLKSYLRRFPDSTEAPRVQLRVIESYRAGGFAGLVAQEKLLYLQRFAIGGQYWQGIGDTERAGISNYLKQFTGELANYHHALAQQQAAPGGKPAAAREHYLAAIIYYRAFIDSFPEDDRVADMGFLLGECLFEVGDYPGAISAYEWVAYDASENQRAADAAYAALLAYERLAPEAGTPGDRQRIASERRFADTFAMDPRTLPVLAHVADALLQEDEFKESAEVAAAVIGWQPAPDAGLLTAARLVLAHSLFEMQQYSDAEQAYRDALAGLNPQDGRSAETIERLAASIYRQGEAAAAAGNPREAAQQFERVISAAPSSATRINAQFDAALNYKQAGDLELANDLLLDFRSRFPGHALAASVGANLVSNYEQLARWQAAAGELDRIAGEQPQADRQRQALYLAAGYYDRSGATEQAVQRYQDYVNRWPQPFDAQMEAMNRLAELYQKAGQSRQQRDWLNKITSAHDQAGAAQSERSLYLAAYSASILADYEYQKFTGIKLNYPIKASLDRKRTAMERAVTAYQKTEAYGVQQFSTLATYRMGRIYQQLGADLMHSDRPDNLDAMALEQYEVLLEEQAYPFEEKAIAIYETNTRRSHKGTYDEWVRKSFSALGELLPARYKKQEKSVGYSGEIY